MPGLALSADFHGLWRKLADLASGAEAVAHGDPDGPASASSAAAALADAFAAEGPIREWMTAYTPRLPFYMRTIYGLRLIEAEPSSVTSDPGLATIQRAADMVLEVFAGLSGEWEHRAQMGDAALAALALAPQGALVALGVGAGIAAPPELVADLARGARDVVRDELGFDLVGWLPWIVGGVLALWAWGRLRR